MTSIPQTDSHEDKCFNIVSLLLRNFKSDSGFSGVTHAMTGVIAVELIFISALLFDWGDKWLNFSGLAIAIAFGLTIIGATLVPDLDNTRSTSHSALGPVGSVLSFFFRGTSVIAQTLIRTSKDDATPNPHRGLWHTLLSSLGLIGIVLGLTSIGALVRLPIVGEITIGTIIAFLVFCSMVHLFLAALAKPFVKKLKNAPILGDLIAFIVSAGFGFSLFYFLPADTSYLWLAIGVGVGSAVHIIGDTFTKYGTPLFFPLSVFTKGRFWWYTRFASIKSGGDFETKVISKILYIASLVLFFVFIILLILH